jgi:hypothetical protein
VVTSVVDLDSLNPDPDPAFQVNPDPGFSRPKNEEKIHLKIFIYIFLLSKLQFTYPYAFIKDVQVTGETFIPQKRTSITSKEEIYSLFSIFLGHFFPPGSRSNPDPDTNKLFYDRISWCCSGRPLRIRRRTSASTPSWRSPTSSGGTVRRVSDEI